jgi:hypothetical protein
MKRKLFILPVVIVGLLVIAIVMAVLWLFQPDKMANPNLDKPNSDTNSNNSERSPDPVKESGPPSSDITPSQDGTGPGPEDDLISQ